LLVKIKLYVKLLYIRTIKKLKGFYDEVLKCRRSGQVLRTERHSSLDYW